MKARASWSVPNGSASRRPADRHFSELAHAILQLMVSAVLTSLDHADLKTGCYSERISCVLLSVSIPMAVFIDRHCCVASRFLTPVPA